MKKIVNNKPLNPTIGINIYIIFDNNKQIPTLNPTYTQTSPTYSIEMKII